MADAGPHDAHLLLVGRLTSIFAVLDIETQVMAWELMDVRRDLGLAVTAGLPAQNLADLVRRVAETDSISPTLKEPVQGFVSDFKSAATLRNKVVHGLGGSDMSLPVREAIRAFGGLDIAVDAEVPSAEVEELIEKARVLIQTAKHIAQLAGEGRDPLRRQ